jgi:hypothetical protein
MDELFIFSRCRWLEDWPVIGVDDNRDGKGEPVAVHKKPNVEGVIRWSTSND